jgi:Protein of unknown function (DUF1822)
MIKNERENYTHSVSLALTAHQEAEKQASQHRQTAKYRQVYYNVLARSTVDFYLQILGIETNWEESESNDKIWRSLLNISDLFIVDYGKIECIPFMASNDRIEISLEVIGDRIAYVFVELESSLREANIIGFLPKITRDKVYLEELEPLDNFPLYLDKFRRVNAPNIVDLNIKIIAETETKIIRLTEWLQKTFVGKEEELWIPELESVFRRVNHPSSTSFLPQASEALQQFLLKEIKICRNANSLLAYSQRLQKVSPQHPQVIISLITIIETAMEETLKWNAALLLGEIDPQHFLRAICCFKIISIGDCILRLRLAIRQDPTDDYIILIGAYPVDSDRCLASYLQLQIFDEFNNLTILDRDTNKGYLQVQIDGKKQEQFSVKMTLEKEEVREYFII